MNDWEPGGPYTAFVRIRVASEEYWAMGNFNIVENGTSQVVVPPSAFQPILQILKSDVDSDPMR